jgi:hypothetical protein
MNVLKGFDRIEGGVNRLSNDLFVSAKQSVQQLVSPPYFYIGDKFVFA